MQASVLGRYRLIGRVAAGGMGEVWRGVDVGYGGIERPIALKRMNPALARDDSLRAQFLDEVKLSFLLSHQNVVQVRDIGEAEGDLYIAMEWVEGADLGTILRRLRDHVGQPLPLRFACLVAVEAARGLDYAHRLRDARGQWLQLVHRDVSPSNLLCSFEGEIKVGDFGIARSRLKEQTSVPGALKGKIGYMAPEQARGETLDARADLFALGAVLYEMLTAQNPFFHDAATEKEAIDRVRACRFRAPSQVVPTLPQGLEAIVMRAMAPRIDERYATLDQLREDLESFARREAYTLSPSDFGQFLRELLRDAPATEEEPPSPTRPATAKRLSASRAVTPRAFNDALGGALAALGSSDDDDDSQPASAMPNGQPTLNARPQQKTVAQRVMASPVRAHVPIAAPPSLLDPRPTQLQPQADERRKPTTDLTDLVPRRRALPVVVAGVAAAGLIAGAVLLARHEATPSAGTIAAAAPSNATAPPSLPAPAPMPKNIVVAGGEPSKSSDASERHKARTPRANEAHLSITTDIAADAYIDGVFIRATPIVDLALAPGKHVVRVESSAQGLRLIPKEQAIELRAGELKQLNLELK